MTNESSRSMPTRRGLLRAVGSGALATGIAGCSTLGSDSDDSGDSPNGSSPNGSSTGDGDDAGPDDESNDEESERSVAGAGTCQFEAPSNADACESPTELSGQVASDETIGADCVEVSVSGAVSVVDGATLTIEPGTRLTFEQDGQLWIEEASALVADGTCEEPIVFTGEQETRGFWDGIGFSNADRVESSLSYCVVEYAGGNDYSWAPQPCNVVVFNGSRVAIDHCTLRQSAGFGVAFSGDSEVDSFEENVATANALGPAWTNADSAGALATSGSYTGNDVDQAVIAGGNVTEDARWDGIDAEYVVRDEETIGVEASLRIQHGTTIAFGQGSSLNVREGDAGVGDLIARGFDPDTEADDPITFTGDQQTRGYWQGLLFNNSDQQPNELRQCVIEYAGSSTFAFENRIGNVVAKNASRVDIGNSTIREGAGYGLVAHWGDRSRIENFYGNEITGNASGAVFTTAAVAGDLEDSTTYTGNDVDVVDVNQSAIQAGDNVEWSAIDARYRILPDVTVQVKGHLTVAPGATVSFDQNASARISNEDQAGALTAVGEPENRITFTGEQKTAGYWKGLKFDGSDSTANELGNCVVEYAGSESFAFANDAGAVVPVHGARVRIEDCDLRDTDGYGVVAHGDDTSLDAFADNELVDNAAGAVFTQADVAGQLDAASTYATGGAGVVDVKQSGVPGGETVEWAAINGRYRILADVTLQIAGTLSLEPGTDVAFESNAAMRINTNDGGGALSAIGESNRQITFTGEQETAGSWKGLKFDGSDDADNELQHCVVAHGGSEAFAFTPAPGNVAVTSGGRLSIADSTLRDSGGYGLVETDDAGNQVALSNVSYGGNQSGDQR